MPAMSDSLLSLYRGARTQNAADFQVFAIRLIKPVLRFESAIWGTGYLTGRVSAPALVPVRSTMHEIDPAGFAYWKSINGADKIIPVVRARPWRTFNLHAPTVFSRKQDFEMREYARRFGRQSYLVTALANVDNPVFGWCSIYRPDPDDRFGEAERRHCETWMAHLSEALRVNDLIHGDAVGAGNEDGGEQGTALAERSGLVVAANSTFCSLCQKEWRQFDGRRIPNRVMRLFLEVGQSRYRARAFTMTAQRIADLVMLTVRPERSGEALPPRRMDVARLFASGYQSKEIARLIEASVSTVRNQLTACYRDLGVSSRTELRRALLKHRGSAAH
jgi:DNA-binding CsgD family transcriptional regulator